MARSKQKPETEAPPKADPEVMIEPIPFDATVSKPTNKSAYWATVAFSNLVPEGSIYTLTEGFSSPLLDSKTEKMKKIYQGEPLEMNPPSAALSDATPEPEAKPQPLWQEKMLKKEWALTYKKYQPGWLTKIYPGAALTAMDAWYLFCEQYNKKQGKGLDPDYCTKHYCIGNWPKKEGVPKCQPGSPQCRRCILLNALVSLHTSGHDVVEGGAVQVVVGKHTYFVCLEKGCDIAPCQASYKKITGYTGLSKEEIFKLVEKQAAAGDQTLKLSFDINACKNDGAGYCVGCGDAVSEKCGCPVCFTCGSVTDACTDDFEFDYDEDKCAACVSGASGSQDGPPSSDWPPPASGSCKGSHGSSWQPGWELRGVKVASVSVSRKWEEVWPIYNMSTDLVQHMADFYLNEFVASNVRLTGVPSGMIGEEVLSLASEARKALDEQIAHLDRVFCNYVDMAVGGEIRHHKALRQRLHGNRHTAWVGWKDIRDAGGVQVLKEAGDLAMEGGGGGILGPRWARPAYLLHDRLTGKIDPFTFVDRCFSLQHNGGCLFNKVPWLIRNKPQWDIQYMSVLIGPAHHESIWGPLLCAASDEVVRRFTGYWRASSKVLRVLGRDNEPVPDYRHGSKDGMWNIGDSQWPIPPTFNVSDEEDFFLSLIGTIDLALFTTDLASTKLPEIKPGFSMKCSCFDCYATRGQLKEIQLATSTDRINIVGRLTKDPAYAKRGLKVQKLWHKKVDDAVAEKGAALYNEWYTKLQKAHTDNGFSIPPRHPAYAYCNDTRLVWDEISGKWRTEKEMAAKKAKAKTTALID